MARQVDPGSEYLVGNSSDTIAFRDNGLSGWGARIRTRIYGFKVRCATVAPRPNFSTRKI